MWMVSRLMVTPFQPRRIAPLGDPLAYVNQVTLGMEETATHQAFFSPISLAWIAEGVTVGSLNMLPMRLPASTASWSTLSSVKSRCLLQESSCQVMDAPLRISPGEVKEFPLVHVNMWFDPLVKNKFHRIVCHLFPLNSNVWLSLSSPSSYMLTWDVHHGRRDNPFVMRENIRRGVQIPNPDDVTSITISLAYLSFSSRLMAEHLRTRRVGTHLRIISARWLGCEDSYELHFHPGKGEVRK